MSITVAKMPEVLGECVELAREVDAEVAELYGVGEALTCSARQREDETDQGKDGIGERQRVNAGRKKRIP